VPGPLTEEALGYLESPVSKPLWKKQKAKKVSTWHNKWSSPANCRSTTVSDPLYADPVDPSIRRWSGSINIKFTFIRCSTNNIYNHVLPHIMFSSTLYKQFQLLKISQVKVLWFEALLNCTNVRKSISNCLLDNILLSLTFPITGDERLDYNKHEMQNTICMSSVHNLKRKKNETAYRKHRIQISNHVHKISRLFLHII
jgi:hypothetical protein